MSYVVMNVFAYLVCILSLDQPSLVKHLAMAGSSTSTCL